MYAVFTNDHLAQLVEGRVRTKAALEAIPGVGAGRAAKYGERFLELLSALDGRPGPQGA